MRDNAWPVFKTSGHLWPHHADADPRAVPVATLVLAEEELPGAQNPPGPGADTPPAFPLPPGLPPVVPPVVPPLRPCNPDFRDGCYEVTTRPHPSVFQSRTGTLCVDRTALASGPGGAISTSLGGPVTVSWKLTQPSGVELLVPDDTRLEADCRVFWSSDGSPLERPGQHTVTVTTAGTAGGVPVGGTGS
ncbi:hypothetical protein [Streptomyces sp. NPDC050388]|uniref:hypothetical protein n=1 Tax=Streptomyces sp. NPDC050388 TaxID=3155781 RepID=UPI00341E8D74